MSKAKCFFVTGTSTDIGKTYISSLLIKGFAFSGLVSYMKPVQTGCTFTEESHLVAPDYDYVNTHAHPVFPFSFTDHVPYCFERACSPHLAASLADTAIDLEKIKASCEKIASKVDTLIIEGAGGLLVPLNDSSSTLDLIKLLAVPVILVTTPGLGTINHTLLTLNQLRYSRIPVAGVIMNNPDNKVIDYIYNDNRRIISEYAAPVPFCEVKYGAENDEHFESFCKRI